MFKTTVNVRNRCIIVLISGDGHITCNLRNTLLFLPSQRCLVPNILFERPLSKSLKYIQESERLEIWISIQ